MRICFVIPVYNEAPTLRELTESIGRYAQPWEHRILFIDDGSTDDTAATLRTLRETHPAVDFIRFRENMGKTRALAVGFARAEGDLFITMDGDLQDRPEEIPALVAKYEEGYDLVCGWKAERRDPGHKVFLSRVYNRCLAAMFGIDLHDVNTGFKAIRADLARRLPLFGDMHRMMAVFAARGGYRVTEIPVKHAPRQHGTSKYGLERYLRGIVDACLAWMLTRDRATHRVRSVCLALSLLSVASAGVFGAMGWLWNSPYVGSLLLLLSACAGLLGGGLVVLVGFVLPLGEWVQLRLCNDAIDGTIAEEGMG